MSSLTGSFQACKDGNSSTTMMCTGSYCAGLSKIPGMTCKGDASTSMTCSNGITCVSVSNLTSSFSMQQNGLNITQTQNISVGSQTFTIFGNGGNFTKTNITTKASHSAAYRFHEPGLKTFMLIAFLLFSIQAYAQTPAGGLAAVENQYSSQLGAVLDPLVVEMCDLVTATPIDNVFEEIVEATVLLVACLELLTITITGLSGEIYNVLGDAAAGADLYGSSLPITDPITLFTAAAADLVVCVDLLAAIFVDPNGNTAAQVCGPILANAAPLPSATAIVISAPTDTSTPTNTDTSAPTSTDVSSGLPPRLAASLRLHKWRRPLRFLPVLHRHQ